MNWRLFSLLVLFLFPHTQTRAYHYLHTNIDHNGRQFSYPVMWFYLSSHDELQVHRPNGQTITVKRTNFDQALKDQLADLEAPLPITETEKKVRLPLTQNLQPQRVRELYHWIVGPQDKMKKVFKKILLIDNTEQLTSDSAPFKDEMIFLSKVFFEVHTKALEVRIKELIEQGYDEDTIFPKLEALTPQMRTILEKNVPKHGAYYPDDPTGGDWWKIHGVQVDLSTASLHISLLGRYPGNDSRTPLYDSFYLNDQGQMVGLYKGGIITDLRHDSYTIQLDDRKTTYTRFRNWKAFRFSIGPLSISDDPMTKGDVDPNYQILICSLCRYQRPEGGSRISDPQHSLYAYEVYDIARYEKGSRRQKRIVVDTSPLYRGFNTCERAQGFDSRCNGKTVADHGYLGLPVFNRRR